MRRAVLILAGYLFFWTFSRWMVLYLIAVSGLIYGARALDGAPEGNWQSQG